MNNGSAETMDDTSVAVDYEVVEMEFACAVIVRAML